MHDEKFDCQRCGVHLKLKVIPSKKRFLGHARARCSNLMEEGKQNLYVQRIGQFGIGITMIANKFVKEVPITPVVQKRLNLKCYQGQTPLKVNIFSLEERAKVYYAIAPLTFDFGGVNAQKLEKKICPICSKAIDFYIVGDHACVADKDTAFVMGKTGGVGLVPMHEIIPS